MQIYVYITFDGIKKFTVAVFLENFLFNKDKPSCQNQPLAMVVLLTAHQMASTPKPISTSSRATGMRM